MTLANSSHIFSVGRRLGFMLLFFTNVRDEKPFYMLWELSEFRRVHKANARYCQSQNIFDPHFATFLKIPEKSNQVKIKRKESKK